MSACSNCNNFNHGTFCSRCGHGKIPTSFDLKPPHPKPKNVYTTIQQPIYVAIPNHSVPHPRPRGPPVFVDSDLYGTLQDSHGSIYVPTNRLRHF
jgi:hypothetical protein